MSVYYHLRQNPQYVPNKSDVLDIMRNKHNKKDETRFKVRISKKTYSNIKMLLEDRSHNIIWIGLVNRHAIALIEDYIVDPSFGNFLPRTEQSFRVSCELLKYETTDRVIKHAYGFD